MKTYDVAVSREDGFWVADVVGKRGVATEARKLANLETEVRDLLAGLYDLDDEAISLRWDIEPALGAGAASHLREFQTARDALKRATHEYEQAQREAVASLRGAQVSLRDAALLLDISFQRVQQVEFAYASEEAAATA